VLAALRRKDGVFGVMLVRRCHIDDFDRRIGAKVLDGGVGPGRKIRREPGLCLGTRVGRRHQHDARVVDEGRQHDGKGATEPRDTDPQLALPGHRCPALRSSLEYLDI
jgi:hypothetical protein